MKKTTHSFLIIFALSLTALSPVLAISPNDLRVTVTARRQQDQEKKQERVEQIQENHQQIRANIASHHADRLERRFAFYHSRLLRLLNKISRRAQIMADDGKDTADAMQTIGQTASALDQAKDKGAEAITLFQSIDPDTYEAQKDIVLQARDLAQEARDSFFHTLQSLKQIISALRQIN